MITALVAGIASAGANTFGQMVFDGATFWLDEDFEIVYVVKDTLVSLAAGYAMKGISRYTSKLTSKIFNKAPNYSQYQHYFRQRGHDYRSQEVYKHMRRNMRYQGIVNDTIDSFMDFTFSFLTYNV